MPIDLTLRSETNTSIDQAVHDLNLTKVQTSVNWLETRVNSLTTGVGSKLGHLVEDVTPELGGHLDGRGFGVHNMVEKTVNKTLPFTVVNSEARIYVYTGSANAVITLPESLVAAPLGTGFELHVVNDYVLEFRTDAASTVRPRNFDGHFRVEGPDGTAFVRVVRAVNSRAEWKLLGTTIP